MIIQSFRNPFCDTLSYMYLYTVFLKRNSYFQDAQETVEELMEKMSILQKKEKNACGDRKITFELCPEASKTECDAHRFLDDVTFPSSDISHGNITSDFLIQVHIYKSIV